MPNVAQTNRVHQLWLAPLQCAVVWIVYMVFSLLMDFSSIICIFKSLFNNCECVTASNWYNLWVVVHICYRSVATLSSKRFKINVNINKRTFYILYIQKCNIYGADVCKLDLDYALILFGHEEHVNRHRLHCIIITKPFTIHFE